MLKRTPAELTLDAVWGGGVSLKKNRPWFGLHCIAECRTWPMTIAWLRVVLKNITSPPNPINPILLLLMSGKLNGLSSNPLNITFVKVCSSLSSSSKEPSITCTYDIASIMFHIIFSHPHSPLVILIDHQTPYCITIVHITLLSLLFPFRSTHLHLFSPPNRPTRSHIPSSARWMPSKVSRSLISPPLPSLTSSPYPSPSIHPPHANTSAAIQDRMGE